MSFVTNMQFIVIINNNYYLSKSASSQIIFRGIHTCVLCTVLADNNLQKRPKHVAVTVSVIKILLCLMGENRNIS